MNYLAHLYLSFHSEPVMVGNFIADMLRGSHVKKYPTAIQLGIEVHHSIDSFTDSHPLVLETRRLLYHDFGKYAAVVQDVFYDHFLAINWSLYAKEPLNDFIKEAYAALNSNRKWMSDRALRTLKYMSEQDWLGNYIHPEGIDRALKGLSHRAKFVSNMENSLPALDNHFEAMNSHFKSFFPQLESHIRDTFGKAIQALPEP